MTEMSRKLVAADGVTPLRASTAFTPPYRAGDYGSQELAGYAPGLRSTDSAYLPYRDTVTARVQDIARNNGWASGLLQRYVDEAIGAQFRLNWTPKLELLGLDPAEHRRWVRTVEQKFTAWAKDSRFYCDASERNTFPALMGIAFRDRLAAGECILLPQWVQRPDTPYRTALQGISPDRLSNPDGRVDGRHLRGGVERNDAGAPLAYHFRQAHPGDAYAGDGWLDQFQWTKVPRKTPWGRLRVIHFFEQESFEQTRGVSILAPVVEKFVMEDKRGRYEMQLAVLNAILGAWVESMADPTQVMKDLGGNEAAFSDAFAAFGALRTGLHAQNPVQFDGVRLPVLPVGDKINFSTQTRPAANFADFETAVLRNIAAATGQSYEQLSQDWSKTNYSSARAALLQSYKYLTARREHFAQGVATPIFALWLEDAIDCGEVELPDGAPGFWDAFAHWVSCAWTFGPGRGWVDPTKEAQASQMRMDSGLSTLADETAEQGKDWEEVLEQQARERDMRRDLGLLDPTWAVISEAELSVDPDAADQADADERDGRDRPTSAADRLAIYERRMRALAARHRTTGA